MDAIQLLCLGCGILLGVGALIGFVLVLACRLLAAGLR